jgi:hypothetical protein
MDYNYVDVAFPGQTYNEKVRELHASYASKRKSDDSTPQKEQKRKRNLLSLLASLFV